MRRLFAVLLRNAFLVGLLTALLLALVWPRPGGPDGFLRADLLSKLGIMLIFFLQGLSLPTSELSRGFRSLRLHAFIQASIFLLAPLFLLPLALAFKLLFNETLASGFIFLALLPTTISSAVAFTSTAGGNTAAALFNTTLANVLGVFWVPLGSILLLSSESGLPLNLVLPLLLKLSWLLLLPLLAGQCLRPLLHEHDLFRRMRPSFKSINNGIILFIVYTAFARGRLDPSWQEVPAPLLGLLLLATAAILLLQHGTVAFWARRLFQDPKDQVAALFCGAQKTLAAGAPMALAIFADMPHVNLGLLLLPLLIYHLLQLFLAATLLPRLTLAPPQ